MLAPRDRCLLGDALRPPPGHRLDRAVGTSYSLDLVALLAIPLAFTFDAWEDDDGAPTSDPLALLKALRRHADRIHCFCQAGRIDVPRTAQQQLLHYLEGTVVDACAPRAGGSFHPKLWLLRFVDAAADAVAYRLLCLSRNLTADRAWDTALVLDGQLVPTRTTAIRANHPLGDFVAALPGCALRPLAPDAADAIAQLADEVRRVRWEPPERVDEIAFWPIGVPGAPRFALPARDRRLLVMSPFLSAGFLRDATAGRPPGVLVSEPRALADMDRALLDRFAEVLVLRPGAEGDASPDGDEPPAARGLHAKLFVVDDGRQARLFTGSANATTSAFQRNVEFLVELRGSRSALGIDAVLGTDDEDGGGLRNLLQPFRPTEASRDEAGEALERLLDDARTVLAAARASVEVSAEGDGFLLSLVFDDAAPPVLPPDVRAAWRPITVRVEPEPLAADAPRAFGPLSFEALTGFIAFEVRAQLGERAGSAEFVLNLPLRGAPPDRRERLLRSLLKDRREVMRLLLLLLAGDDAIVGSAMPLGSTTPADATAGAIGLGGSSLLETLLRALDADPRRLDEVARIVDDLRRTPEGAALLPEGFAGIWEPIWQARAEAAR